MNKKFVDFTIAVIIIGAVIFAANTEGLLGGNTQPEAGDFFEYQHNFGFKMDVPNNYEVIESNTKNGIGICISLFESKEYSTCTKIELLSVGTLVELETILGGSISKSIHRDGENYYVVDNGEIGFSYAIVFSENLNKSAVWSLGHDNSFGENIDGELKIFDDWMIESMEVF